MPSRGVSLVLVCDHADREGAKVEGVKESGMKKKAGGGWFTV